MTSTYDLPMEESLNLPLRDILTIFQDRIMTKSVYHGIQTHKGPIDFWTYQEIIYEQQPDLIIEIGVRFGGSTLALAHMLDRNDKGRVLGVDVSLTDVDSKAIDHKRIHFLLGDAKELEDEITEIESQMAIPSFYEGDWQPTMDRYQELQALMARSGGGDVAGHAQEILKALDLAHHPMETKLSSLSGGEKAKVALARQLVGLKEID